MLPQACQDEKSFSFVLLPGPQFAKICIRQHDGMFQNIFSEI